MTQALPTADGRRQLPRWFAISVASAVFALGVGAILRGLRTPTSVVKPPIPAALPPSSLSTLRDALPSDVPTEGAASYRAAVQMWLDGSSIEAVRTFRNVSQVTPSFAAAALWSVISVSHVDSKVRESYQLATQHRAQLTPEQAEVLDAFSFAMQDPPDRTTTAARLSQLLEQYPDDELKIVLAQQYYRLDDPRGIPLVESILQSSRARTVALYLRALFFSLEDDAGATRRALRSCTEGNVSAMDCLRSLRLLESNEGNCAELEPICRREMTLMPSSSEPFECYSDALHSAGAPIAALVASNEELFKRLPERARNRTRARYDTELAIASGHLRRAEKLAEEWQAVAESDYGNTGSDRAEPYMVRAALAVELHDGPRARSIARAFESTARTWQRSDLIDTDAIVAYLRSLTDDISPTDRATMRQSILEASSRPSYGWPGRQWYNTYVLTSWSKDEAIDAIAHMPRHALTPPQFRRAYADYWIAHTFALAGDMKRAERSFARASHSCSFEDDYFRTSAKFRLARIKTKDSPAEACRLYAEVVKHWGSSPESDTVVESTSALRALACEQY